MEEAAQNTSPQESVALDATGTQSPADAGEASSSRRMPEEVRKTLLRLRDGSYYLPVAGRLVWFRSEHPDWRIITEIVQGDFHLGWMVMRAQILDSNGTVIATGHKSETKQGFPDGWVEKAETGAIGRALAIAGYGAQYAIELQQDEGNAPQGAPVSTARARSRASAASSQKVIWQGPDQCPKCHAPKGKAHAPACPLAQMSGERRT